MSGCVARNAARTSLFDEVHPSLNYGRLKMETHLVSLHRWAGTNSQAKLEIKVLPLLVRSIIPVSLDAYGK